MVNQEGCCRAESVLPMFFHLCEKEKLKKLEKLTFHEISNLLLKRIRTSHFGECSKEENCVTLVKTNTFGERILLGEREEKKGERRKEKKDFQS